ncbi:membrane transporter [Ilyonectria sp. MPI-CAGE-AT-0026]|nr:membrane transporter [Ilyonectria sp. MPI-CAGE-AT-0026]
MDELKKSEQEQLQSINSNCAQVSDLASTELILDPVSERRIRRKIDLVVLPLMCLVFFTQYLDKQSLAYAAVFGLVTDFDLHGTQYSWLGSIFFIGQLVSEFPFMYLMSKLPLARFVGFTVIVWGIVCMCLAAAPSYKAFLGVRFALGFAEGAVSPAFVSLTSIWYTRKEHPLRIGLWISCNGLAQVLGALLMYGIGKMDVSLAAWKVMFLVCGAMTTFLGIVFTILMPAGPDTAWFLSPSERLQAKQRLQKESEGGDQTQFSLDQLKEAVKDIRTYLTFCFGVLITLPAPVIAFASLIISGLGYDKFDTMLYTSPSGAVQITFIWIAIGFCYLWPNHRCAVVIGLTIVPMIGIVLLFLLPLSGWGMIAASWLASVTSNIFTILLSLSASNVRGNTKKSIVNAMFFVGYAVGAIGGPQLWNSKNAPRYRSGLVLALASWVALIANVGIYWYSCYRENVKRSAGDGQQGEIAGEISQDCTDKKDKKFRYTT